MSAPLQVFLISPGDIIVYSFTDPSTGADIIFNAGSLSKILQPIISDVVPISGMITPKFQVNPTVFAYDNGKYELVYAPSGDNYVYRSDGSKVTHNKSQIHATSKIQIPDTNRSTAHELLPLNLSEPNVDSIQKFIEMSHQGIEYQIETEPIESPKITAKSPSPRAKQEVITEITPVIVPDTKELKEKIHELEQEVQDLKSILKALNQRIYQIYPVDLPTSIRVDKKQIPVISLEEITKKMNEGKIERYILDPLLQPYAGSHRSQNRLLTFYEKDGNVCHVRAEYDPKANKINPAK